MHKKPLSPILLILVFITLGCSTASTQKKTTDVDIYVGTEGLTAEFAKTAPPPKVFENSDFPILLRIRNKGAYSITSTESDLGVLMTLGIEKDYVKSLSLQKESRISGTENEVFFYLDGKKQINPSGDEIIVALNAKTGKLEPQSENKLSTITATFCYPYQTVLSTTVCIDPDVGEIRPGKKVCKVKEISFSGQGAPIAVTKIEPQMIPEGDKSIKPQFLIFIENKGKGNPVNRQGYHNTCRQSGLSANELKYMWNVAFLTAYGRDGRIKLDCSPNMENSADKETGFIRFRDKKDFVRCTFKEGVSRASDAFLSPLRIEIDYGYVQTVSTNFAIQKPLRY